MIKKYLYLLILCSCFTAAHAQSDLELVKAFGKALEARPLIAREISEKDLILDEIWNRKNGVKEDLEKYLENNQRDTSGNPIPFTHYIIYFAQQRLSSFLQHAFDTNNDIWMREIASLYEIPYDHLTASSSLSFEYPDDTSSPKKLESRSVGREFKLWLNPPVNGLKAEDKIASSQFLHAISVIIHYAVKNNLQQDEVFKRFISKYLPVAFEDHYLRWILNRGIPVGSFSLKGWGCNSGSFSHLERVQHLKEKRFGTKHFEKPGRPIKPLGYCNSYQDMDGWIALGLGHLLEAERLKPGMLRIDLKTFKQLKVYLQDSVDLFQSRSEIKPKGPGSDIQIMNFDLGGLFGLGSLAYSGYYGSVFPGWVDEKTKKVKVIPPDAPKVSWDMGHAQRFVNFYWSFDKLIKPLALSFPNLEKSAKAYANNLFHKTIVRKYNDSRDFLPENIAFTNFICGNNGWYRVNYKDRSNFGYKPSSLLGEAALTGGQAYFVKYNKSLLEPLLGMRAKLEKKSKPYGGDIYAELNSNASLPDSAFYLSY
jgi:hypothetical protein